MRSVGNEFTAKTPRRSQWYSTKVVVPVGAARSQDAHVRVMRPVAPIADGLSMAHLPGIESPPQAVTSARRPRPPGPSTATGQLLVSLVVAEARPCVQAVVVLRVLCFAAASTGGIHTLAGRTSSAVAGWSLLSMSIYLLNGVTDVDGDRANGSRRPIASGRLPAGTAVQVTALLASAGLLLCALHSRGLAVLGIGLLSLGWAYSAGSAPLKSTTAGSAAAVGGAAFLSYAAGAVIGGGLTAGTAAFAASFALWVGLCSATKDFSDVAGDRLAGRRTWPVLLGDSGARRLVSAISAVSATWFVVLAPGLPADLGRSAVAAGVGAAVLAAAVLVPAPGGDRATGRRPYRVFMAVQYTVNWNVLLWAFV